MLLYDLMQELNQHRLSHRLACEAFEVEELRKTSLLAYSSVIWISVLCDYMERNATLSYWVGDSVRLS